MFVDYYQILEIDRNATNEQIKTAYREQAFLYHPDRNSEASAHQKFVQLGEAYRILSNPLERQKYNRLHDRHHGRKTSTNNTGGFESLERTRAKRASRYNRSLYNQRMRYRGGSTTSSTTSSESKKRPPRTYSEKYEKIVLDEAEASVRGFSLVSKILRGLCLGVLVFSIFLLVDKALSIEKTPEIVLKKEAVPWSFTQPSVIKIKTKGSTFGVHRSQADKIAIGSFVQVKKSMFGDIPVKVMVKDYGEVYTMDTYGCRYDSPFELIWLVLIFTSVALIFRRNPEHNTYLGTLAVFVSLNILGLIFWG